MIKIVVIQYRVANLSWTFNGFDFKKSLKTRNLNVEKRFLRNWTLLLIIMRNWPSFFVEILGPNPT